MPSVLPQQILPQTAPLGSVQIEGQDIPVIIDVNWYLLLYNLCQQALSTPSAPIPITPADVITYGDIDVFSIDPLSTQSAVTNLQALDTQMSMALTTDIASLPRQIVNVQELLSDQEAIPTLRDLTNALVYGQDTLLPDVVPQAQPSQAVTVGASPYTYTALASGALAVSGGTISAISIIRQGVTVATGVISGVLPVSRRDQVTITYTVLPTVVFLPT